MHGTSAPTVEARSDPVSLGRQGTRVATGIAILLAITATLALAFVHTRIAAADLSVVARALVYALIGGWLLAWLAVKHEAAPTFGAANAVTLARGVLALDLLALLGSPPSAVLAWSIVALALLALVLDGVDGKVARHRGETSAFGARFDMETDALLVLALALLVCAAHQAGAFVLLSGALRYLFIAAGLAVPALAAPLPPSQRRKAVCVAQSACLVAALVPAVPPSLAQVLCAGGLALLAYSFAVDAVRALSGRRSSHIMPQHVARDARP